MAEMVRRKRPVRIFDPFAGVGKVHALRRHKLDGVGCLTAGVEIEREWADQAVDHGGQTLTADFLGDAGLAHLAGFDPDVICSSPTYGNRMADVFTPKDKSRRHGYALDLGRTPTGGSSAVMQWGPAYRLFHQQAIGRLCGATRPGTLVLWNVAGFVRQDKHRQPQVIPIVEWHLNEWMVQGCTVEAVEQIDTPHLRHGRNAERRVVGEKLLILRTKVEKLW